MQMERAGFAVRQANAMGKRTFTPHRLVPPLIRPKLDWIALRELRAVAGSAATVAARPGFFNQRVSDHDFVTCEVALEAAIRERSGAPASGRPSSSLR